MRAEKKYVKRRAWPRIRDPNATSKRTKKQKIRDGDRAHLEYFEQLAPFLEQIHDVGCDFDTAGNRDLHYDQSCLLILLFLFNPIVDSLGAIQQASELEKVHRRLGCFRKSLGSLSEANQVFDPELLKPIIAELKPIIAELGEQLLPISTDKRQREIQQTITLVDGTLLSALPQMMEASVLKQATDNGQLICDAETPRPPGQCKAAPRCRALARPAAC